MHHASGALLLVCGCALTAIAWAQTPQNPDWAQAGSPPPPTVTAADRVWKEAEVPPPPVFSESRLVPIEMPHYMSLKFGVDPATIVIDNSDGVVRYVVVAANKAGGAVNAFYEGVRCATGEMKTYARFNDGEWNAVPEPEWTRFKDMKSSYASELARQGLCRGHAPRASVGDMLREIRNPVRPIE